MKVGVVIPTLNMGRYLEQAINSVQEQTVKASKLVIVDGGSTDGTIRDLFRLTWNCQTSSMNAIVVPAKGIAHARNYGIERMPDVDVIVPLDADDWLLPNYIERCLAEMNYGVGIVAPALRWADSGMVQYPKEPVTISHLLKENCIFGCSMFRRAAWADVGGYDEHPRTYEDWDFWLRIMQAGWQVSVVREPLYCYRPHLASSCARMKPGDHEEYVTYLQEKHAVT